MQSAARPGFSSRLSWSHYRALLKVDDPAARAFYEVEAASENWTVENLDRRIFTQLHLRLRKSRNKEGVLHLARRGQVVERPVDTFKDPVVMDLFDLPHSEPLRESDLETAIISKLSQFLLELGKASRSSRARSGSRSRTRTSSSISSSTTSS